MKKRLVTFLAACMVVGTLAGCGAAEPVAESSTAVASSQSVEASQSSEPEVKEEDPQKLYEAFLDGSGKVYTEKFDGYRYDADGSEVSYYGVNDGYTLDEFLAVTLENESTFINWQQIGNVTYQFIDCGADGVPELLLKVWLTVDEYYPAEREYVMKAMDGKLQLTYQNESDPYTQEAVVSDTGAIALTSMYSYDYWYEGSGYLDANGQYRQVYNVLVSMYSPASYVLDARFYEAIAENEDQLEDVYVRVYRIGEAPEDEDDTTDSTLYYCGEKTDDEPSNGYDFKENVRLLQEVFDKSGEKLYSMQEIQSMIAAREKAIGVTDAMKQGKECKHIDLKMKDAWTQIVVNEDAGYDGYEDMDSGRVELAVYAPDDQIYDDGEAIYFYDDTVLTEYTNVYVLDEDTVFGGDNGPIFFEGYEFGDTPLTWARRMLQQQEDHPTALVGVFDIAVSEGHIDVMDGIYWWD